MVYNDSNIFLIETTPVDVQSELTMPGQHENQHKYVPVPYT